MATKQDLEKLRQNIMSVISDYTARQNARFDAIGESVDGLVTSQTEIVASQSGVSADIAALKDIIKKIQQNPGPISPEDQQLLNAAEAKADSLVTKTAAVSTALAAVSVALKALDEQTDPVANPPVEPPSE